MDTPSYQQITDRNLGFLTQEQQDILSKSSAAVFGLGGLGAVIAEILCRCGIGRLNIVDNDRIDTSNLNRHIFAFSDTIGRLKTETAEQALRRINPGINIKTFLDLNEDNIADITSGAGAAILAIDKIRPCLVISRACREKNIPLVEGWAIAFGNVRVFTKDTPSLEEAYRLDTIGIRVNDISQDDLRRLDLRMLESLKGIEGLSAFYPPEAIKRITAGKNPCFAPTVWLTAVLMSLEAIKVILGWGKIALAPRWAMYDPFANRLPSQDK